MKDFPNKLYYKKIRCLIGLSVASCLVVGVFVFGVGLPEEVTKANFLAKNLYPSWEYPFGTDRMGRNMFLWTMKSLATSIGIGFLSAMIATLVATFMGILASLNQKVDKVITFIIDSFLAVPHMLLMLLVSFALGRGYVGVIVAVSLTHWPSLTRLVRMEIVHIKSQEYIKLSKQLGIGEWELARKHILPHLLPQLIIGFTLIFPHAILHESAITFLGFGFSPTQPSLGIILSESLKYITTGMWWLCLFPGLCLLITVMLFDSIGKNLKGMLE